MNSMRVVPDTRAVCQVLRGTTTYAPGPGELHARFAIVSAQHQRCRPGLQHHDLIARWVYFPRRPV
jgi:hypothetical protein